MSTNSESLSGDQVVVDLTGSDTVVCFVTSLALACILITHGRKKYVKHMVDSQTITLKRIESIRIHDHLFGMYSIVPIIIMIQSPSYFNRYEYVMLLTWSLCCQFAFLFWLQSIEFTIFTNSNPIVNESVEMFNVIPWYSFNNRACTVIPLCKFDRNDVLSFLWLGCCIPISGAVIYCMYISKYDFVSDNYCIYYWDNMMFTISFIFSSTIICLHLLSVGCQYGIRGVLTCGCTRDGALSCRKFCASYWFGLCLFCFFSVSFIFGESGWLVYFGVVSLVYLMALRVVAKDNGNSVVKCGNGSDKCCPCAKKGWCVCTSKEIYTILCLSILFLSSIPFSFGLWESLFNQNIYLYYAALTPSFASFLLLWFVIQSWIVIFVLKYLCDQCYCLKKKQNKCLSCIVWLWLIGLLPFSFFREFDSDVYVPLAMVRSQYPAAGYLTVLYVIQSMILYLNVKELRKFVPIFVSIFLSILDLTTDIALIIQWYENNDLGWCVLLGVILIFSQIISTSKWSTNDNKNILKSRYIQKTNDMNKFDYFMSIIGLGRPWMGSKAIATNLALKIELTGMKMNEIQFESMPSVCLQLYVILTQYYLSNKSINYTVASIVSLCVTVLSMTFSIWIIFKSNVNNYKYIKQGRDGHVTNNNHSQTPNAGATSIELTVQDMSNATGIKSDNVSRLSPKSQVTGTQNNNYNYNDSIEMKDNEYSSFFQFIVFSYLFCDFYCRGFQLVLICFVNKIVIQQKHVNLTTILSSIAMTSTILISYMLFDVVSLKIIRNKKYRINSYFSMEILQLAVVSFMSNVINLFCSIPLKTIVQKMMQKSMICCF